MLIYKLDFPFHFLQSSGIPAGKSPTEQNPIPLAQHSIRRFDDTHLCPRFLAIATYSMKFSIITSLAFAAITASAQTTTAFPVPPVVGLNLYSDTSVSLFPSRTLFNQRCNMN